MPCINQVLMVAMGRAEASGIFGGFNRQDITFSYQTGTNFTNMLWPWQKVIWYTVHNGKDNHRHLVLQ